MVDVETQEWRDFRMRDTEAAVHRNKMGDNNNPLIYVSPEAGLKKEWSRPVASG